MKAIPNPVGFVLMIGITVAVSLGITGPAGRQPAMIAAGLVTTFVIAGIVALGLWVRRRYGAPGSNDHDS